MASQKNLPNLKIKRITWIAIIIFAVFFALMSLYHLGPIGIKAGDERVLANHQLANGDRLFIIAHRTESWIEPYNIRLYRVHQETNYFVCFLSHEDAYWWGCSFIHPGAGDDIGIKAFGISLATYVASNHSVVWNDHNRPSSPSYKIDGIKVIIKIPEAISFKKY